MKRYIRNIQIAMAFGVILAAVVSCADDLIYTPNSDYKINEVSYNDDGSMNVVIGMDIPEWNRVNTRAMGDNPDFLNLGIYMLVFQDNELTQYARLSGKEHILDSLHINNNGRALFRTKLWPTEKPAVIHLIATNQDKFSEQIGSGIDEEAVGRLYTKDGAEAYWQRIDLGVNIPSREQSELGYDQHPEDDKDYQFKEEEHQKALGIMKKLNHVPMVRNFAKVSVRFGNNFESHQGEDGNSSNFELTGLYVINTLDRGSVAPYRATYNNPEEDNPMPDGFVEFFEWPQDREVNEFIPYTYRKMTDNPNDVRYSGEDIDEDSQNYVGNMPVGNAVINTDVKDEGNIMTKSLAKGSEPLAPIYFYERSAMPNSMQRTYAVVKIRNKDKIVDGKPVEYYYKIDFGHVWDPYVAYPYMGVFEYYNLLRNFHYEIRINRIDGDGYDTLEGAANGPVFNNISASVEAKTMKSISDGEDWIYVSKISHVFTQKDDVLTLLAQYREKINEGGTGGIINNNVLITHIPVLSKDADFVDFYKENGTANMEIKGDYVEYTIRLKDDAVPGEEFQTQEFYIYRGPIFKDNNETGEGWTPEDHPQDNIEYGLYRIVTLYLHERFQFRNIDTFPGLWEDPNELPDFTWSENYREIDASVGAPLTLFFELPSDLPMAVFPLEFVIEADRQNIQNAYAGNAVVRSVPASDSLFADDPTIGTPTTSRIQYVKTVTWKDYNGDWGEVWTPNGNKMVRCRFLTITDLNQDGVGTGKDNGFESKTTLRVYNEYFGTKVLDKDGNPTGEWLPYQEDGFYRNKNTSDPTPRIWDFSSSAWDDLLSDSKMNYPDRTTRYSGNNSPKVDDLTLTEVAAKNMHYGTTIIKNDDDPNDEGTTYRYIQTTATGDNFSFSHKYLPHDDERELMIEIMVTDKDGKTQDIAKPDITGISADDKDPDYPQQVDGVPFKRFRYVYKVPAATTDRTINITIAPPQSAPNMKFYRIEFYPRWDDLKPSSDSDSDSD